MENLFDFDGSSSDFRLLVSQTDPKDELITSLKSFSLLHSQRRLHLERLSESFTLTAVQLREDDPESGAARVVLAVFGGALGSACGLLSGGVWGFLGAVSAATFTRICGKINAVGATVGFFGSVLGGVVGGVFCGALGGATAGAYASPPDGAVSDVAWFTIGCATGGAMGGTFGGTVGAAGGAVGGAFGGLCATRFSFFLVGGLFGRFHGNETSNEQKKILKKQKVMEDNAADFRETIKPLLQEMKTIKSVSESDGVQSDGVQSDGVQSVAAGIERSLDALIILGITLRDALRATDLQKFVSGVEEAAKQSRSSTEELRRTSEEVEKLLETLKHK